MANLVLAAFLALEATTAQAPSRVTAVQPIVDSPEERRSLQRLLGCLAEARPRWARQMLAQPYLSEAQARAAGQAASGRDTCITGIQAEVTFRTSSIVAGLAEHYVRSDIGRADFARVSRALLTLSPRNVSEDFAFCVASRDPAAARDLALSDYGSEAEADAGRRLARHVESCTNPGEQLTVDLQALRALSSTALYRGMTTVLGSGY